MNSTSETRGILEEDMAEGGKHWEGHSLCYARNAGAGQWRVAATTTKGGPEWGFGV